MPVARFAPDPVPRPLDHLAIMGNLNDAALITRDGSLNYGEIDARTGKLAAWLAAQGLKPGDRVASWLAKTVTSCLMPLATARAAMVHVPINPLLKRAQVAHILADSGARLLISGAARLASLEAGDCPQSCVAIDEAGIAWQSAEALPCSAHDPATNAAILYTSGSTGKPKGVVLSHANLWLGAVSVAQYLGITPEDRVLGVLPLSFDYGQNQLLSSWVAGAAVAPLDYLTPRDVIRAVDRFGITTIAGVPPLWVQLVAADWPAPTAAMVKRITNSGGALTPSLIDRLRTAFPSAEIYPMYGLTEAFRSTYLPPDLIAHHSASIGRAIPFAEVIVIGPDGAETADDKPGELVHCGPLVAQGYWGDTERSALRFRPAPPMSRYGGTAVWSGDTVRRDAKGLLYFVGRDDEMIKTSGNRVSPTEIEDAAQASGAVAEAVAFGVADDALGAAITLVATPIGNDEDANAKADARLRSYLKAELPGFMQPKTIVWQRNLPRNPNGKLDRAAIAKGATA